MHFTKKQNDKCYFNFSVVKIIRNRCGVKKTVYFNNFIRESTVD